MMSALPPSISDHHDDDIGIQLTYSPRKRRMLSTSSSYYCPTATDDDRKQVNCCGMKSNQNATKEQSKSPNDEHQDVFDVHRQIQLNYFSELFYQNSPQTYGSPLTKNNNIRISTRHTNRWKLTTEMPRPLNLLETLEPANKYCYSTDKNTNHERILNLFTTEENKTDGSSEATLILRTSQPQLENEDQAQAHPPTFLAETNDSRNVQDPPCHHDEQPRNDITEIRTQLDVDQKSHSLGGLQDHEPHHTTEPALRQPDTPQESRQKQKYPLSDKPEHIQQSTQYVTMKEGQNDTTPTGSIDTKMDRQHARKLRIQQEMDKLTGSVKKLSTHYRLLKKVGSGTFSSVYKAQDLLYDNYDNTMWEGTTTSNSPSWLLKTSEKETAVSITASHQQKYVALKQIYATSSPKRMAQEIKILKHLKGTPNVCQIITAFRSKDHVFLVMPYFEHCDFMDYYRDMNLVDIKYYMTALLTALKHLHAHHILHRDIKPNNFLYDKRQKTGMLIDFGLAQMESETRPPEPPRFSPSKPAIATTFYRQRSFPDTKPTSSTSKLLRSSPPISMNEDQSEKPGYIKNDQRKPVRASKAGTRGFRAPEILLRVTHQTVAIDIWSVGVILLSLLSGRYPFFIGHDESDSLIEIASIFGLAEMKECATLHNRTFETNIETIPPFRKPLSRLCQALNDEKLKSWTENDKQVLDQAIDLLEKMLTLNYKTRITAEDALKHPFLFDTPFLASSSSD